MSIYSLACDRCESKVSLIQHLKHCQNTLMDYCGKCAKEIELFQCKGCKKHYSAQLMPASKTRIAGYCSYCAPVLDDLSHHWEPLDDNDDSDVSYPPGFCSLVHTYSTNPVNHLSFMGKPKDELFYGIELELHPYERKYGTRKQIRVLAATLTQLTAGYAILKADSSITPGVELVTCPASLAVHRDMLGYFFANLPRYTAETSSATGMHIHVSRKGITPLTLGKLLVFYNCLENRSFISAIAGRESEYAQYQPQKKIKDARWGCAAQNSRREAINLEKSGTIEFRIFASSINPDFVFMRLEFVVSTIAYCQNASYRKLDINDYLDWLDTTGKTYKNLRRFLELASI